MPALVSFLPQDVVTLGLSNLQRSTFPAKLLLLQTPLTLPLPQSEYEVSVIARCCARMRKIVHVYKPARPRFAERLARGGFYPLPRLPSPTPPCAIATTSCERLLSGAGQLEHLDGLEPAAVAVEAGQRREYRAAHEVEQGVTLRGGELRLQQRRRLQAVGEAEGLADGSSDEPVPHRPGLEDYPSLHASNRQKRRRERATGNQVRRGIVFNVNNVTHMQFKFSVKEHDTFYLGMYHPSSFGPGGLRLSAAAPLEVTKTHTYVQYWSAGALRRQYHSPTLPFCKQQRRRRQQQRHRRLNARVQAG